MSCNCRLCVESRAFSTIIEKLSADDKKWMEDFYELVSNERFEAGYKAAVLDGSWPSADEVIASMRTQREERRNG